MFKLVQNLSFCASNNRYIFYDNDYLGKNTIIITFHINEYLK